MSEPVTHPNAEALEALSVGDGAAAVSAHVGTCDTCRVRVEALRREREAFLAERPPELFMRQLERRAAEAPTLPGPRRWWVFVPVGLAASLAVVIASGQLSTRDPGVTMKGSLLTISVLREGRALENVTQVRAGDRLRFSVQRDSDGYGVVLERDGTGAVTVVAPFGAAGPVALTAGRTTLPDSAELDDSAGPETFVAVLASRAFSLEPLLQQLRAGATVQCDGCQVDIVTLEKLK